MLHVRDELNKVLFKVLVVQIFEDIDEFCDQRLWELDLWEVDFGQVSDAWVVVWSVTVVINHV